MLNVEQLLALEDNVLLHISDNITSILTRLNRINKLEEFMDLIGLPSVTGPTNAFSSYKTGKIVVIGKSFPNVDILLGAAKTVGMDKERFEFCLDYDRAEKFNYKKMQYNPKYSLVLFGPTPHSGYEKEDFSSIITAIENKDGYPPVLRVGNNELKISKTSFKQAIIKAKELGFIQ